MASAIKEGCAIPQEIWFHILNSAAIIKFSFSSNTTLESIKHDLMGSISEFHFTVGSFDFKSTEDNDKFFSSLQLFLEETFNYPDYRKQEGS